jgi:hypothetical protein
MRRSPVFGCNFKAAAKSYFGSEMLDCGTEVAP